MSNRYYEFDWVNQFNNKKEIIYKDTDFSIHLELIREQFYELKNEVLNNNIKESSIIIKNINSSNEKSQYKRKYVKMFCSSKLVVGIDKYFNNEIKKNIFIKEIEEIIKILDVNIDYRRNIANF